MDPVAAPSPYDTLQVSPSASPEVIRAAYRAMVQRHHPDRHPDQPDAASRTAALNAAYAVLSDPQLRQAYDRQHAVVLPEVASDPCPLTPAPPPVSRGGSASAGRWVVTYAALICAALGGAAIGARQDLGWVILWWVLGVLGVGMPRFLRALQPPEAHAPSWPLQLEVGWCVMAGMMGLMFSRGWWLLAHV